MPEDQPETSVRVECQAGHRADEAPVRFYLGARCIEVIEVLDRWLAPDHRYFRVLGGDGDTYILRHDTAADRWELTLFARGARPGAVAREIAVDNIEEADRMLLSEKELTQARETVTALLDTLGIPAYLFEVEPRGQRWEVRVECALDSGWQSATFAVDDVLLAAARTDAAARGAARRLAPAPVAAAAGLNRGATAPGGRAG